MMRIKTYRPGKAFAVITCIVVCLSFMSSHAEVLPVLQSIFAAYQKNNLQEKLCADTNKSILLTGEILTFKLYNTDGGTNKMLDLSKVAYVELLDNKHIAVLQAKIPISQGTGTGSFYIPFSISNGNYELRAYTHWM